MSRMNGKKTHTHTPTRPAGCIHRRVCTGHAIPYTYLQMFEGLKITTQKVMPVCSIPTQTRNYFITHSLPVLFIVLCRNIPCHAKQNQKECKTKNKTKDQHATTVYHIWEGCNEGEGTSYLVRYMSCYTFCHLPPALLPRSCVLSLYHSPTTLVPVGMVFPPPGLVIFCILCGAAFAVFFWSHVVGWPSLLPCARKSLKCPLPATPPCATTPHRPS